MKKLLAVLLITAMMLATLVAIALPVAAEDTFDPNAENPTISTAADYIAFFNAVYNQKMSFKDKTITMTEDITVNDTTAADWYAQSNVMKLTPTNDYWAWFEGTFDGGNHTLTGVIVEGTFRMNDVPCGLFPYAREAVIKNLIVDGFYVCSTNVEVEASYGNGGTGGLVGHAKQNVTIDNCKLKNGIVTCVAGGKGAIGAVVGAYDGQVEGQKLAITNCTVEESVSVVAGADSSVALGGLIGYVHENFKSHPTTIDLSASRIQPNGSMDADITLKPLGFFRAGGAAGDVQFSWTVKNKSTDYSKVIVMDPGTYCTDTYNTEIIASKCYGSSCAPLPTFTVTWIVDGKTTTEDYPQGSTPSYKGSTDKPATDTNLYVFKEWSPKITTVTADVTYTAVYDEYQKIVITWVVDGETTVEYYIPGVTPSYPGETNKEQDDNYLYIFKGWDKEIKPASEDVTYTAVYENKAKYQIKWVIDGKETTEVYLAGVKPSFKGKVEKAEDNDYTYKFTGWDKEIVPASANAVYTAQFEKTAKNPAAQANETATEKKSGCKGTVSAGVAVLVMMIGGAGALTLRKKHD